MIYRRLAFAFCLCLIATGVSAQAFTDDPLVAGVTPIRAVHITELRTRVDALRDRAGRTQFAWTDPTITPGVTIVRAAHLLELRSAFADAYGVAYGSAPSFSATITAGVTIAAAHINELRAFVVAMENLTACLPSFAPGSGSYTGAQTVTISCSDAAATIRYTTDGSTPTSTSQIYSAPLTVTSSMTVKAVGFRLGWKPSAVASANYTITNCNPSLPTTSASPTQDEQPGSFAVSTSCSWTASSNNPDWLSVTGFGNGSVNYAVTFNGSGSTRTGTITVTGQTFTLTFTVVQSGVCVTTLNPGSLAASGRGGPGSLTIEESSSSCTWMLTQGVPWVNVTPKSGTGTTHVSLWFAPNFTGGSRNASVTIGDASLAVSQEPGGAWMSHIPTTTETGNGVGHSATTFLSACNNMAQWPVGFQVTAFLGSWMADLDATNDTDLHDCFAKMTAAGLQLTIEAPAYIFCPGETFPGSGTDCYNRLRPTLLRLIGLEAPPISIRIDSSLTHALECERGELPDCASGVSASGALAETATFVRLMRQNFADVGIASLEGYPYNSANDLKSWMSNLTAAAQAVGVRPPDLFELDQNLAAPHGSFSDVPTLASHAHGLGWTFGYVFGSPASLQNWYDSAMTKGNGVQGMALDVFIFESWETTTGDPAAIIPDNPTTGYTFMSTVRDFRVGGKFPR